MQAVSVADALGARSEVAQRAFFATLLFVTAVPLLGLGLGLAVLHPAPLQSGDVLLQALTPIFVATGFGHVASTSYLYIDRDFWALISANKLRFFAFPAIAVAISVATYEAGAQINGLLTIALYVWLLLHYQRQNYGVIAFAAQHLRRGPLPPSLRWMLDLGAMGGICCSLPRVYPGLASSAIWDAGVGFLLASTTVMAHLLITSRRVRTDPMVLAFTTLGWLFFMPALVSSNLVIGFYSYAVAHGAQYFIFMLVISRGNHRGVSGALILAFATISTFLVFVGLLGTQVGTAVYTGIQTGHFIVDAKFWRMREPVQRSLLRERFSFLFS